VELELGIERSSIQKTAIQTVAQAPSSGLSATFSPDLGGEGTLKNLGTFD